jgi:hypothetical protein
VALELRQRVSDSALQHSESEASSVEEVTAEELLSTVLLTTSGARTGENGAGERSPSGSDAAAGVELGMLDLERLEAEVAGVLEVRPQGAHAPAPVDAALAAEEAELDGLDLDMLAGLEELESLSSLA